MLNKIFLNEINNKICHLPKLNKPVSLIPHTRKHVQIIARSDCRCFYYLRPIFFSCFFSMEYQTHLHAAIELSYRDIVSRTLCYLAKITSNSVL
jgi:hypothetical protein